MTFSGGVSVPADYGKPEPLFDPPARCGARGCEAGDRQNLCAWAADIAHGRKDPYAPKPKSCLLRIDPRDGEIPF